jgi:hypothetical protein
MRFINLKVVSRSCSLKRFVQTSDRSANRCDDFSACCARRNSGRPVSEPPARS